MTDWSYYIVTNDVLANSPPGSEWHAHSIAGDPTRRLLKVLWDNPNHETEFEQLPDVLFLGEPWEEIPVEAAALIASIQDADQPAADTPTASLPSADPPPAETVGSVLRKCAWLGARGR